MRDKIVIGYCRISTSRQNLDRQERNILVRYPDALIYKEVYTGTKITGRKVWNTVYNLVCKEAIAVCLIAGSALTAYAQDQDVGNMNGINSGTSTLTYEVDSNYAVVIPETINMNEQYSFTSHMMDLKDNESVVVFVDKSDEEITMTEKTSGKTAKLHFNGGETDKFNRLILARFSANQNTSDITFNGQMETTAGSYSGTCTFYVELQDSPIM